MAIKKRLLGHLLCYPFNSCKLMDQYYRHFRNGKLYHILEYATIESTEEEAVVYEAMYDDHRVWIRPKSNFFEEVSHEGKMVSRFQPVPLEEIQEELDREFDRELEEVKALHKQITDELHALYSDAELRVAKNSLRMKSVQEAVDEGWVALDMLQDQMDNIGLLDKYYAEEWKSDFEADEKGEINKDIDRSVLGEDTLYNLLDEIHELRDSLRSFTDSIRYPSDDEKVEE